MHGRCGAGAAGRRRRALEAVGPLPERAGLGHGPRGLQRRAATAWDVLPHDHARSAAYRWSEDGLGGICDDAPAPVPRLRLLERPRPDPRRSASSASPATRATTARTPRSTGGTSTPRRPTPGCAGATCTPRPSSPTPTCVAENRRRGPARPRVRAARHRRARRRPLLGHHRRLRQGRPRRHLHPRSPSATPAPTRPRSTCCPRCGSATRGRGACDDRRPALDGQGRRASWPSTTTLGRMVLTGDGDPELLFCENETNAARLWGVGDATPYPKDGIGDHVVARRADRQPRPDRHQGRPALPAHRAPRAQPPSIRLRLAAERPTPVDVRPRDRRAEPRPTSSTPLSRPPAPPPTRPTSCARPSPGCCGPSSSSTTTSTAGSTATPPARRRPAARQHGRNAEWRHLNNADVISMPDTWEYPWYAAWDLAFHCVALAHVDPEFAKDQLLLMCREWYMHPNGQLPAYEWTFGDVNPPVHAWAALRVFEIDGVDRLRRSSSASSTSCCSTSRGGSTARTPPATTSSRAASSASTTSAPSTAPPPCRSTAASSSPTAPPGWPCTASTCWRSPWCSPSTTTPTRTWPPSSSSTSPTSPPPSTTAGLWDDEDGFYYDVLAVDGRRAACRCGCARWSACCRCAPPRPSAQGTLDRLPDFAGHFTWFVRPTSREFAANVVHRHRLATSTRAACCRSSAPSG